MKIKSDRLFAYRDNANGVMHNLFFVRSVDNRSETNLAKLNFAFEDKVLHNME